MIYAAVKPHVPVYTAHLALLPVHTPLITDTPVVEITYCIIYFPNSLVVALATVLLTLSVSAAGAYGLTRCVFPGREKVAGLILMTYMFAPIMIIIPFYILVKRLGLVNTHLALVLSYTTFCLPFCLWL